MGDVFMVVFCKVSDGFDCVFKMNGDIGYFEIAICVTLPNTQKQKFTIKPKTSFSSRTMHLVYYLLSAGYLQRRRCTTLSVGTRLK